MGRYTLYITFLMFAMATFARAGGIEKDPTLDKSDRTNDGLEPPTIPSWQLPADDKAGKKPPQLRPSFPADSSRTGTEKSGHSNSKRPPGPAATDDRETPAVSHEADQNEAPQHRKAVVLTRQMRQMIRKNNRQGRARGHIKIFAPQGTWGPPVKIQSCFGDNILTRFTVSDPANAGDLAFQFQTVRRRNSRPGRKGWKPIRPGELIRGRYVYLRARNRDEAGIVALRVVGICIDDPPRKYFRPE